MYFRVKSLMSSVSWQRVLQQLCGASHTISAKCHVPSQRSVTYHLSGESRMIEIILASANWFLFILSSSFSLFFQYQRIAACDSTLFGTTIEFIYDLQFSLAKSLRFGFDSPSFLRQNGTDISALNLQHLTRLLGYSVVWSHGYWIRIMLLHWSRARLFLVSHTQTVFGFLGFSPTGYMLRNKKGIQSGIRKVDGPRNRKGMDAE